MIYIHICARNDTSGNPRRCFVVLAANGSIVEVIDEGYSGTRAVTDRWPAINQGPVVRVGVRQYKLFVKIGLSDCKASP